YAYLREAPPRRVEQEGALRVLLALPGSPVQGAALLRLVMPVWRRMAAAEWYVKLHPDYTLLDIQDLTGQMADMRQVSGSMGEWLARSDVLITLSSGVALEALTLGVPVIQVNPGASLSLNPLEWFGDGVDRVCYSAGEVA